MKRIATGVAGLDVILDGGIPEYSTTVLGGRPGAGKTILAQQILFNEAKHANVLYLATLSEPQINVIRYQQQFPFFDRDLFMNHVIYRDIGSLLRNDGLDRALDVINDLVKEYRPSLIVIDSIKAISDLMVTAKDFRVFLSDLNTRLSLWECTTLLLGEYSEEELGNHPVAAIADGIIFLYGTEEHKHQKRYLRILKLRGTNFSGGEHALKIQQDGIRVYPRLNPNVSERSYAKVAGRHATGIPGLDWMTDGGFPRGTTTMISGSTGTGKTSIAFKWLHEGAIHGEPGIFVTFEEHPAQLAQLADSYKWGLSSLVERGLLEIIHMSPIEIDLDEFMDRLRRIREEKSVVRIAVDSISAFEIGLPDKFKFTDYLWGLSDHFKSMGVSFMMTCEANDAYGDTWLTKHRLSFIADSIVHIHYVRNETGNFQMRRGIRVIKMRGVKHDQGLRELTLDENGPHVIDGPED